MDNDSSLKYYLARLNDAPLLTRDEENKLLASIEEHQIKILRSCAHLDFFKSELKDILSSMSTKDIIKISRKLHDKSTPAEVKAVKASFIKLVECLEQNKDIEALLPKVGISGTIINTLVLKVKKKYDKVSAVEEKLDRLKSYFRKTHIDDIRDFVNTLQEDKDVLNATSLKFRTDPPKVLAQCHELEVYDSMCENLKDIGLDEVTLKEVRAMYKKITQEERKMKVYRDELVQKNLRLVVSRAKRFTNKGLDFEDLIQEGNLGLIKAIDKHDASRGVKVGTYATWWIDQSIRRAISNKSRVVRIPTHIEFMQSTLAKTINELTHKFGRTPNLKEIAEASDINLETLEKLQSAAMHQIGIEDETESTLPLIEVLKSDASDSPHSQVANKMMREKIRQILATLHPRTEKLVRLRFGIGEPNEELTLQQIADRLGITKMGVKMIEGKAFDEMSQGDLDEHLD